MLCLAGLPALGMLLVGTEANSPRKPIDMDELNARLIQPIPLSEEEIRDRILEKNYLKKEDEMRQDNENRKIMREKLRELDMKDYKSRAELGDAFAQVRYGLSLKNKKDRTQDDMIGAVEWFRKAADQGCPEAYYELAVCYENGDGLDRNLDRAEIWYRKVLGKTWGLWETNPRLRVNLPVESSKNDLLLQHETHAPIVTKAQEALDRIAKLKEMENERGQSD